MVNWQVRQRAPSTMKELKVVSTDEVWWGAYQDALQLGLRPTLALSGIKVKIFNIIYALFVTTCENTKIFFRFSDFSSKW